MTWKTDLFPGMYYESLFLGSVHAYIASTKIICRSRRVKTDRFPKHAFKLLSRFTPKKERGLQIPIFIEKAEPQ